MSFEHIRLELSPASVATIRLDGTDRPVRISMRNLIGRPVLEIRTRTQVSWDERYLVLFPG